MTRPTTPPQGSRSIPWDSYHDLPAEHPVFLYPDDVREKMYKKGIGTFRPHRCQRPLIGCALSVDLFHRPRGPSNGRQVTAWYNVRHQDQSSEELLEEGPGNAQSVWCHEYRCVEWLVQFHGSGITQYGYCRASLLRISLKNSVQRCNGPKTLCTITAASRCQFSTLPPSLRA